MSLASTLVDITDRLRRGEFPSEQAISQGVVLRVLHELGWNTFDTGIVWPEYQTGGGRADFALCHPARKPAIFIEVKQAGKAESGVQQALQYAFTDGIPFVVLTDGKTWSFYLPAERGDFEERRVYKLDLYERSPSEAAEAFRQYLAREAVTSGASLTAARAEYKNRSRRSQAKAAIPEAWRELVQKRDDELIRILAAAVESRVGFAPEADDVAGFLGSPAALKRPPDAPGPGPTPPDPPPDPACQIEIRGKRYDYPSAAKAMVAVLTKLAAEDPSLMERCAAHPDARGRKLRYIARTAEELYPDTAHLRSKCEKLPGGWLVATNLNNAGKRQIVELAARTAGLTPGTDVVVRF